MTKTSKTIVFFGSGPVAARALELLAEWCPIEAVVTKPQPPHHKEAFPVLAVAEKLGLKTLTPGNKKELSELFATKPVSSTLGIVIDYGIIINRDVIDYFPLGILNSHFSLLPRWRGADPISFAILNGDPVTGVSLMQIVEALDEGPILTVGVQEITPRMTTPELTSLLIGLSDGLLRHMLPLVSEDSAKYAPQEVVAAQLQNEPNITVELIPTYSRKLEKQDGVLDFTKTAEELDREIRAFYDWPKSRTQLAGTEVIITEAHPMAMDSQQAPGTVEVVKKDKLLLVHCGEGYSCIDKLKPAGKKEMTAEAFIAGYGRHL